MQRSPLIVSRRRFLQGVTGSLAATSVLGGEPQKGRRKAQIAITFDLEMSRHYPKRGMMEWDYQKGNLDEPTKQYSVDAARMAKEMGGLIHFFCVGRVLEQPNVDWLTEIASAGHPIGNHTYDHVYVLAKSVEETQFRFRRSPWLAGGQSVKELIRENIRMTNLALQQRANVKVNGFRTPGGFHDGLSGREDIQRMLLDLGFRWVSSKYPRHTSGTPKEEPSSQVFADILRAQEEAQPRVYPTGLIEIPMSPISDVTAFRSHYWRLKSFLRAIQLAVEWAIKMGGVFDFLCHPSCMVVEDPDLESIKLICSLVRDSNHKAEIVGLDDIAKRVK